MDAGRSWFPFASGLLDESALSAFLIEPPATRVAIDRHGIYRVLNGNSHRQGIDQDLPDGINVNAITRTGDHDVIGSDRILVSLNNGRNWTPASTPMQGNPVRALQTIDGVILAGTAGGPFNSLQGSRGSEQLKEVYRCMRSDPYRIALCALLIEPVS